MRWVKACGMFVIMSSLATEIAASELPPPVANEFGDSAQTFESFLYYLAEFEDDQGNWVDPITLEPVDSDSEVRDE